MPRYRRRTNPDARQYVGEIITERTWRTWRVPDNIDANIRAFTETLQLVDEFAPTERVTYPAPRRTLRLRNTCYVCKIGYNESHLCKIDKVNRDCQCGYCRGETMGYCTPPSFALVVDGVVDITAVPRPPHTMFYIERDVRTNRIIRAAWVCESCVTLTPHPLWISCRCEPYSSYVYVDRQAANRRNLRQQRNRAEQVTPPPLDPPLEVPTQNPSGDFEWDDDDDYDDDDDDDRGF